MTRRPRLVCIPCGPDSTPVTVPFTINRSTEPPSPLALVPDLDEDGEDEALVVEPTGASPGQWVGDLLDSVVTLT